MKKKIEIAQEAVMLPVREVAEKLNISQDDLEFYGKYKAQLSDELLEKTSGNPDGKLVLVTAINPTPAGEGKCTFTLPNFVLEMPGAEPMVLGDIVVNDVTTSEENGTTAYNGEVKGLQLAGGSIVADVTLNGTISGNNVVMNIDVMWSGIPIKVTFTSTTSGINDINADLNAPVEYFNIQGMRVDADNMTPGIYVKRQGNKVSKILVK